VIFLYVVAGAIAIIAILLANRKYMHWLMERRVTDYQNELVTRHCNEVENIYKQMRGWRHDYHNHIQLLKAYLAQKQFTEVDEYLSRLDTDLTQVDTILKTGNIMIDAILNSKVSLAQSKQIAVSAKAIVPKALQVQPVDLCVIIGNLLDNAIEACSKISEEEMRFIRVYIGVHKELLYISVSNASAGEIKKTGKTYLTTKSTAFHGFGLMRIDKIVEKYQGFVDRDHDDGVFATEVMLPL